MKITLILLWLTAVCTGAFAAQPSWLKEAVFYQIYPSSYQDSERGNEGHTYDRSKPTRVSSHDTSVKNQGSQNYYSSHPDYATPPTVGRPATGERPALVNMAFRFGRRVKYNDVVVPHTKALGNVSGQFEFTMPENSIGILRLKPIQ